ncbi:hypothetical protein ABEB36_004030 [Hypothenemus hampei]|uniref:ESF1 homolog n=1 Tax=Hypothenemus hampei TaxID=57062 RepID=A0ABD1F1Y8_HYPHA
MEDKRFEHIKSDPKFRRAPKSQSKVKIDKRFQSMFTDKKFQVKYTCDKRGRPVRHHSTNDLKRYYDVSSEESETESVDSHNESGKYVRAPQSEVDSSEEIEDSKNDILNVKDNKDKTISEQIKGKLRNLNVDYARGEKSLYSESSSDDEESDDEVSDSEEIEHKWGELDADAERTENATHRLAACNLDWDRIRAVDLMVLFSSFLPSSGTVESVIIYPSEFGKERLKEEEVKGPIELVKTEREENSGEETEEGSKYHMEKLRQYQLNRLKYYYAVITFDSAHSANKIYTECDGMEYESSATKLDLRFIPDDMTFDDQPKEQCNKLPDKYEPRFFTTTALQQAKVELTWDETNPDRLEFTEKLNTGKLDDISEKDLQNYLASSSGEEDNVEDSENESVNSDSQLSQGGDNLEKYRALLQDIEVKEKEKSETDVGLEISWGINLKEKTDKLIKEKQKSEEEKTPFQKYLDKRKEKRKEKKIKKKLEEENSEDSDMPEDIDMNDPYFAEEFNKKDFKKTSNLKKNKKEELKEETEEDKQRQAELALLVMNGEDTEEKKHFNFKKIQESNSDVKGKKKKIKKKDKEEKQDNDEFKVNVNDARFSALFTNHHYNIDPSNTHYKKTKAMEALIEEKIKRGNKTDDNENENTKKPKLDDEYKKDPKINLLIKKLQRHAQAAWKKTP